MSLCSGVGGIELGFKLAVPSSRAICYIENEAFACGILKARMQDKILDQAPIWTDLRTFDGKPWRGKVDCLTGGYPCQPFSVAGKKLGEKDPRHLWPEIKRLISEIEPPICFFENVGGHLRLGFEQVANDLSELGYKVKAGLFTAQEVGAPHKRERLFILAYSDSVRSSIKSNGNIGELEEEIGSQEKTRNQSSQATKNCCSGIRELANCCVIGCECRGNNFCKRHLQNQQIRNSEENQQEWQGRITGACEDCKNVADCEKFISERSIKQGNSKQQSQEKIRSRNSELANSKMSGARKHESRIWQGIKKHCDKLANPNASDGEGGIMEWRDGKAAKLKLRDHSVHAVKSWATPTTRDWKDGSAKDNSKTNSLLGRQAPRIMEVGKNCQITLNPLFTNHLMGWPIGWTRFEPVAMAWCHWLQLMRGEFLAMEWIWLKIKENNQQI